MPKHNHDFGAQIKPNNMREEFVNVFEWHQCSLFEFQN